MPPKKDSKAKANWFAIIRQLYLYTVSGVSLIIMVIASIGLVNLVVKEYVLDVKSWNEINGDYWECDEENVNMEKFETVEECMEDVEERQALQAENDIKRDLADYFSMLIVSIPLYTFHWLIIRKEKQI